VSGGLAHQLRNGLAGARLAVQLHLRETNGIEAPALEVALRQLQLLESYLKRFLDLGRTGPLRGERCNLASLTAEAVELLRPRCQHAGTELIWRNPGQEGFYLQGDPAQLAQLILNLLGNAIDAAGPGGVVEARLRESKTLGLEILDNGPGPAPDVAEKLFEPFVTGKPEGVGLGLAVARQVAQSHGGEVSWRRDDGRTCFQVELPRGTR
jgi:signal transduction histidine kinase